MSWGKKLQMLPHGWDGCSFGIDLQGQRELDCWDDGVVGN